MPLSLFEYREYRHDHSKACPHRSICRPDGGGSISENPLGSLCHHPAILLHRHGGLSAGQRLRGAFTQLIYVLLGLLGLPIFTAGGGFSYVLHPTFGFLLGLIPAAWVIGRLARSTCSFWRIALAALAGLAVLYAVGLPYMAMILNGYMGKGMDLSAILWAGMLPFLPGDALKILVTAMLTPPIRRALDNSAK